VVLRPWAEADAEALSAATHEPLMRRHSGMERWSLERAREVIASTPGLISSGTFLGVVIADPETDGLLGQVSFHRIAWADRRAEIGFWLSADARGRGAARAGVPAFLEWAIPVAGVARVDAFSDVDNPRAHAVLEAAGFVREGELASYGQRDDGSRIAAYAYGLVV
jgi:ribosomal-protein-alanine N-acetyltransferase